MSILYVFCLPCYMLCLLSICFFRKKTLCFIARQFLAMHFYYAFCYMAQLISRNFFCLMLFTFSLQDEQTRNVYLSRHWLSLYYNCFSPGPLFTNDFACSHGGQGRLCARCQFLCTFFGYCSYIAILITLLHSGLVSGCA